MQELGGVGGAGGSVGGAGGSVGGAGGSVGGAGGSVGGAGGSVGGTNPIAHKKNNSTVKRSSISGAMKNFTTMLSLNFQLADIQNLRTNQAVT